MTLYDIIVKSSEVGLRLQDPEQGTMPAGHNGLYHDNQTPVRNTSHWTLLFLKAYEITGDDKFRQGAEKAIDYLTGREARPMNAAFWHRTNPRKDTCNGVIGQAWTIEALVEAGKMFRRPELLDLAEEVFLLHPFDEEIGIWQRVASDGMQMWYDETFNHQLWFAAIGSLLAEQKGGAVSEQIDRFMDKLDTLLRIYSSGLIYHKLLFRYNWQQKIKDLLRIVKESKHEKQKLRYKAVGYHPFNLYAFALLKKRRPSHSFWSTQKFKKALDYVFREEFKNDLSDNVFAYPYNPTGFEMLFAIQVLGDNDSGEKQWWLRQQLERCFDYDSWLMTENTEDPETHSARLYEAVRLEDLEIS